MDIHHQGECPAPSEDVEFNHVSGEESAGDADDAGGYLLQSYVCVGCEVCTTRGSWD